jgi:siderophore synthetase component
MTPDTAHLTPDLLERSQRHLLAKALGELAHERLVSPEPAGRGRWRVTSPDGGTVHEFAARRLPLDHWLVDPATVERRVKDEPAPPDVQAFVAAHAAALGIPDALLPTYLEELASTLASGMWKLRHSVASAATLAGADHQTVESGMTEGHPAFLANNGRIGLDLADYTAYAPEAGPSVRLLWLAARRSRTHLALGSGLTEESLYAGELDAGQRAAFDGTLRERGLDPADYLLLPVHPWQFRHHVAVTFAPDVARGDLVPLGETTDDYRPQQSIRTFANTSRPDRHYVKTALAIQNMGFVRGLSPAYMEATPAINDWVAALVERDETLRACGFSVLRERAAIGYTGDAYHALDVPSPYHKMLAALWREPPAPRVGEGERLMTMAALLHRDADGVSLVSQLVERSGLAPVAWVRAYLRAYVRPIVHCLLAHDLAFMPHGENLVLVLRDDAVSRVVMKDIGEEVCVMSAARPVPVDVERVRQEIEPDVRALALHTDVFDGVLRFLAAILDQDGLLDASTFWDEVAAVVEQHRSDHPELAEAASAYDLQRAEFRHSCLNRLQLRNTRQMVDLSDQAESLMYAGTLTNPIARATVDP